jgi:hypothetical protein
MFIDWVQHTVEYPEGLEKASNAEVKEFLQSAQVQAAYYLDIFSSKTTSEIMKAGQVERAFQQVLDEPASEQALQHPALRPLAELAAD